MNENPSQLNQSCSPNASPAAELSPISTDCSSDPLKQLPRLGGKSQIQYPNGDWQEKKLLSHIASLLNRQMSDDCLYEFTVRSLYELLPIDIALIGQIQANNTHMQTLAVWKDGQLFNNFSYPIADSPCETAIREGLQNYKERVRQHFPNFPLLADLEVESYVACCLRDRDLNPMGLLCVMGRSPLPETSTFQAVLQLFALRVANELERQQQAAALHHQETFLKAVLDAIPQMVFWKDRNSTYRGGNRAWTKMAEVECRESALGKTDAELWKSNHLASQYVAEDRQVLESGKPFYNIIESRQGQGNQIGWHSKNKVPLKNAAGETIGILGTIEDITARKQFDDKVQFLQALALEVSEAPNFRSAITIFLKQVCQTTGWVYGKAWIPSTDGKLLLPAPEYYSCLKHPTELHLPTGTLVFRPGIGLPGRVWASRQPERVRGIPQLSQDLMLGQSIFERLSLNSAMALPIVADDKVLAVFVFFSFQPEAVDDLSIEFVEAAVSQLSTIMQRLRAEEALREAEKKYRSIFENAVEGIFQSTPSGQYLIANPMLAKIYGYDSPQDLVESISNIGEQIYVDADRHREFTRQLNEKGSIQNFEAAVYRKDGSVIWISENARTIRDTDGIVVAYEGTVVDITARHRDRQTIEYMAYYDLLTGLANRVLLSDRLTVALSQAHHDGEMLAVLFLDIDRFKTINDTLGHGVGDVLLQGAAKRLMGCVRESDTIARWGGDEFTVLLTGIESTEQVKQVADRILVAFGPAFNCEEHLLHVTTSIGIAVYPSDGNDFQTLLKNADTALYRAKEKGRNTYQLYTPSMNAQAARRLTLENHLRHALELQELEIYYQPQIDLSTGRIIGLEALLRWQHPRLGLLSPNAFISIAEETGLIVPIGEWVLENACHQVKHWQKLVRTPLKIAVNLSAYQFQQSSLLQVVSRILDRHALDADCLELEITENIAMQDVDLTVRLLTELRHKGVNIAIDDFGTGYSSIGYLRRFPFDILKIDRTFVKDIGTSQSADAVIQALISLGQGLNLSIVAEGVETYEQVEFLKSLQCLAGQGYLFSKPAPAKSIEEILQLQSQPSTSQSH